MRYHLLLPTFALLPLCSYAQTAPAAGAKFYVGLGATSSLLKSPDGFGATPVTPVTRNEAPVLPQLTAGWQLAPRLALQLGVRYAQQRSTYTFVQSSPTSSGSAGLFPGFESFRFRSVAAPVLLRYTLTQNPAQRLQVDALGGVTLVRRWTQYHTLRRVSAPDSAQADFALDTQSAFATTDVHTTLGLGVRYRVAPRLEIAAEVLANYLVNTPKQPTIGTTTLTGVSRFAPTGSVGVNYHFGFH